MAEFEDDALLLRAVPYSESSLICHVLTREHGKVHVMARGARRAKSHFRAALLPLYRLRMRWRPGRTGMGQLLEVQRGACLLDESRHLQGMSLLAFAARLFQEGEAQGYRVLSEALARLQQRQQLGLCVAVWFCLQQEGWLGDMSRCWHCDAQREPMYWRDGQLSCAVCGTSSVMVSPGLRKGIDGVMQSAHVQLSRDDANQWKHMIASLLNTHHIHMPDDFLRE